MKSHCKRSLTVIFFLVTTFNASISMPSDTQSPADGSIKSESRKISTVEKTVLELLQNERIADLTQSGILQKQKPEISVSFLKNILFGNGLGESVSHKGIGIIGAIFNEELDLENGEIKHQLRLEKCQFKKKIDMRGVISRHGISFKDSTIQDSLILTSAKIGANLELDGGNFRFINAENTTVNGGLTMQGTKIHGHANLQGIRLQNRLQMNNAEIFGQLKMKGSRIEGWLEMKGIIVTGDTDLESTLVNGDLVMDSGNFNQVNLAIADIRGRLLIHDAEFQALKTYGMEVKNAFRMKESKCKGKLHLQRAKIGSTLDLRKSIFLDDASITGAKIAGDVYTDRAEFQKTLNMEGITTGGNLVSVRTGIQNSLILLINIA